MTKKSGTELRRDLVIVGAGPVGLALAAGLVRAVPDLLVTLIDRQGIRKEPEGRAYAVSAGARRVLQGLGAWEAVAGAASPVAAMKITDSGRGDLSRPLFLEFSGEIAPGEPFAHMVPGAALGEALAGAAAGRVEMLAPAEVTGLEIAGPGARVSLANGRGVVAPLVVAADGTASRLREMAGIKLFSHDYRQTGLVATVGHERDHQNTAYEHFRPAGPFASLPLPGRRSSLVWTETPEEAARLAGLGTDELAGAIEAAMGSVLGAVTLETPIKLFPLHLQIARRFVGSRVALVGDAAHVIHPLAGQGLNLGLADVAALAEAVVGAVRLGEDAGSAPVLARYERARQLDTALMAAATDGLNRLFSNDLAGLRAVRDFGLSVVDRLDPLKSALIRRAAG